METIEKVFYKGEELSVTVTTPPVKDNIEYIASVRFFYKKLPILKYFSDRHFSYKSIVIFTCEFINEMGLDIYKEYSKKEDRVSTIRNNNIVIDKKVYDYDLFNEVEEIYKMYIKMSDGTTLGGESFYKDFYNEESKNKQITFNNLNKRVNDYYMENDILPDKKHINDDLTDEYVQLYNWFNEKLCNKYYKHIFPSQQ